MVTGDDLRVSVHRHLMKYPELTAYEIARALGQPHPSGGGGDRVRRQLARMEIDGEAGRVPGTRGSGDKRPSVRWVAI